MGDRHTRDLFAPASRDPESEREYSRRADPGPPHWQPGARILVGTSGYSFPDWVGPFYPPGLKSADMLSFYSERFPAVEVNSTYYRVPPPRVTARMAEKTPPAFRFVVKAPQSLTHERRLDPAEMAAFRACLEPLQAADKLDGVLLQFPWSFRPDPTSRRFLAGTRAALPDLPLWAEFRNARWASADTFADLRAHGLGYCIVDEPALPGLMPPVVELTAPAGYVRFHGRNAANWWGRGGGDRYDYLYSPPELMAWVARIHDLARRAEKVYVFFNNCHAGQAARNAQLMQELLLKEG